MEDRTAEDDRYPAGRIAVERREEVWVCYDTVTGRTTFTAGEEDTVGYFHCMRVAEKENVEGIVSL